MNYSPNTDTGSILLSRQARHDNDSAPTANAERLQETLADLKACKVFMLAWVDRGMDLALERSLSNDSFDDFQAMCRDYFSSEIGHLENKLSDPLDKDVWGGAR